MEEATKKLLEECTAGCKMAIHSMEQVKEYVKEDKLLELMESYMQKHRELEKEAASLLKESKTPEKEPGVMAIAFSWVTTEMKLMLREDSGQIAKLMMNGCNMGIQSISEQQNKYTEASKEAKDVAKKLVKIEEDFMKEMKEFL